MSKKDKSMEVESSLMVTQGSRGIREKCRVDCYGYRIFLGSDENVPKLVMVAQI